MSSARSAIILAGGKSTRMSEDKGLKELFGEPLVKHVMYRVSDHVDEILVVVGSEDQKDVYSDIVGDGARVVIDLYDDGSPLVGALTGFSEAKGDYALVTGCDMPFISHKVIQYLFNAGEGRNGAVFRWPNGWVEPLIAIYRIKPSLDRALRLYNSGSLKLRLILLNMEDVEMVPIETLMVMDPELLSLYDIDTEEALDKAKEILKSGHV
jgi:molybdopterin-guanine dinucleotide biosynthesis protein A